MLEYTYFMAMPPPIAFAGTTQRMWPERKFSKTFHIPHTATLPILRLAAENEIKTEVENVAKEIGIPANLVLKQGQWSEHGFQRDGRDHIEITFTTKMFLWVENASAEDFNVRRKLATWSGGPRDGQKLFARNGEIVWDGPLGVLVHDQVVVWRDVGEGARAAWLQMSPEEQAEFRHEIEDDAGVLVSHDAEIAPPYTPPEYVEPLPSDSPLAPLIWTDTPPPLRFDPS